MDIPGILIKITGFILFLITMRSIYRHIKSRKKAGNDSKIKQSVIETVLNNILLYLWLAFMTAFSIGMIVNN